MCTIRTFTTENVPSWESFQRSHRHPPNLQECSDTRATGCFFLMLVGGRRVGRFFYRVCPAGLSSQLYDKMKTLSCGEKVPGPNMGENGKPTRRRNLFDPILNATPERCPGNREPYANRFRQQEGSIFRGGSYQMGGDQDISIGRNLPHTIRTL